MFYKTNREARMVNAEREIFEYVTSRHQPANITISKAAICGMNGWEWANVHAAAVALSHQVPKYLDILQRRYHSAET
jgi:hypothetical protein